MLHEEGNFAWAGGRYFRKGTLSEVGNVKSGRECNLRWETLLQEENAT